MTEKASVADDTLGRLARKQADLFRRVHKGSLPADVVMRELQLIIEGRFSQGRYAEEEVESIIGYPKGFRIRSVVGQIAILSEIFPGLDASHVATLSSTPLPDGAEGWAVIPKPNALGGDYYEACKSMVLKQQQSVGFEEIVWEKYYDFEYLGVVTHTAQIHNALNRLPGDYWVFPFQFGLLHRGRSVRRARELYAKTEFGLGVYEGTTLLLTHKDRISAYEGGSLYPVFSGTIKKQVEPWLKEGDAFSYQWYTFRGGEGQLFPHPGIANNFFSPCWGSLTGFFEKDKK